MLGDPDNVGIAETIAIPDVSEFERDRLLGFERDLLGVYISERPLTAHVPTFEKRNTTSVIVLAETPDQTDVTLGGIITALMPFTSKKSGEPMAFFTLEDTTGSVSCTMFPSNYANQGHLLEKDRIVILQGRVSYRDRVRDDEEGGHIVEVLAESVTPGAGGASGANGAPKQIHIKLDPTRREMLRFVRETLEAHRGNGGALPVYLHVPNNGAVTTIRTPIFAEFNDQFRAAVEKFVSKQTIWVE